MTHSGIQVPMARIIVGLGNPGWRFLGSRHNIGFRTLDTVRKALSSPHKGWARSSQLKSAYASGNIHGIAVVLAKPMTYMNNSGFPVRLLLDHYKVPPESLIVIHDDKDIPLGRVKAQRARGHGGHNGVRSIIEQIKTKDFYRIRIGVARTDLREMDDTVRFVLSRFRWSERKDARKAVRLATERLLELI